MLAREMQTRGDVRGALVGIIAVSLAVGCSSEVVGTVPGGKVRQLVQTVRYSPRSPLDLVLVVNVDRSEPGAALLANVVAASERPLVGSPTPTGSGHRSMCAPGSSARRTVWSFRRTTTWGCSGTRRMRRIVGPRRSAPPSSEPSLRRSRMLLRSRASSPEFGRHWYRSNRAPSRTAKRPAMSWCSRPRTTVMRRRVETSRGTNATAEHRERPRRRSRRTRGRVGPPQASSPRSLRGSYPRRSYPRRSSVAACRNRSRAPRPR